MTRYYNDSLLTLVLMSSFLFGHQMTTTNALCPDPLASILATLDCIEQKDPVCASQGYNAAEFKKLHNEIDTNTVIDEGGTYWSGAFALVDLALVTNYERNNIGPNQASIRYVEVVNTTDGAEFGLSPPSVEYPFGQTFVQHEHALVTVDNDCKMTLWDQYGDNQEQAAVDNAVAALLEEPAIQCAFGMLPPEACTGATGNDGATSSSGYRSAVHLLAFATGIIGMLILVP